MCDRRWAAAAIPLWAVCVVTILVSSRALAQATGAQPEANTPTVVVTGLDSDGLEAISPESPGFDARVGKQFSVPTANAVLSLKPLLVIFSNHTQRTVVAFAFVWKITYPNKRTNTTTAEYKYPDAIAGSQDIANVPLEKRDDLPLPGGQQKLVAPEIELGPSWEEPFYRDQLLSFGADQKRDLADAETIEITLDAAIFSDGQLVGPDHSNLEQSFMAEFESEQKFFRQIVADLDAGHSIEEAFAPVTALAQQHPPWLSSTRPGSAAPALAPRRSQGFLRNNHGSGNCVSSKASW